MTPQEKNFVVNAARLAQVAPKEWSEFLAALVVFSDDVVEQCVVSQVDKLPVAQGRAQFAREILRILWECKKTAEQLTAPKNAVRTTTAPPGRPW